ncbi:MAG TPA: class GN sortase [Candidatus Angelobacter sp.]|nr:class GN sortase [Candidatus Angelobacter sp.]
MRALRLLCVIALMAGAGLTARAAYLHAKAELAGILIRRAWQQSVETGASHAPWPWADTHPIGRLQIPRLDYDEIVLEGATPRTLAFGPARMFTSAEMGEPGNLVLAGHRTSWFRRLEAVRQGDTIQLEWYDAHRHELRRRNYTVATMRVVDPQELNMLAPTPDDALTLLTCYPFGSSPRSPLRYVVRAVPDRESQRASLD